MFEIDLKSRIPIYEQIVANIKKLIQLGILKSDDKLPSIRELSKSITINPNTIQKAYRQLENDGYIYTVSGQGSFVSPFTKRDNTKDILALYETLKITMTELLYLGEDENELLTNIKNILEERTARE